MTEVKQIGEAKMYQGECLREMGKIPVGSVDMVMTDPPYGTTACKWDSVIPLSFMWQQLRRVIKPSGAIVMTASQPFTSILVSSNLKEFRHEWIWQKTGEAILLALSIIHSKSMKVWWCLGINRQPITQLSRREPLAESPEQLTTLKMRVVAKPLALSKERVEER